jgi:hypothetical protein
VFRLETSGAVIRFIDGMLDRSNAKRAGRPG